MGIHLVRYSLARAVGVLHWLALFGVAQCAADSQATCGADSGGSGEVARTSVTVVIPTYNSEGTIIAALDSVVSSARYMRRELLKLASSRRDLDVPLPPDVEIVVVDDYSSDNSAEYFSQYVDALQLSGEECTSVETLVAEADVDRDASRNCRPLVKSESAEVNLLQLDPFDNGDACSESMVSETSGAWLSIRWLNAVTLGDGSRNKEHSFLGHGHARNRGVSRSCGDILMFLDADDLFMDPHMLHLWLPLALNEKWAWSKSRLQLEIDGMHPYWIHKSEKVLLLNIAVRRRVYQLVGGLPQGVHEGEDEIFFALLKICCNGFIYPNETLPTATYKRYPGNHLDVEKEKYSLNPIHAQFHSKTNTKEQRETRARIEASSHLLLYSNLMQLRYAPSDAMPFVHFDNAVYRLASKLMPVDKGLALEVIKIQLRYNPGNAQAWRDLYVVYKAMSKKEYAKAALFKSLDVDPQCHHSIGSLSGFPGVSKKDVISLNVKAAEAHTNSSASFWIAAAQTALLEDTGAVAELAVTYYKEAVGSLERAIEYGSWIADCNMGTFHSVLWTSASSDIESVIADRASNVCEYDRCDSRVDAEKYWESRKDSYPKLAATYVELGKLLEEHSASLNMPSPLEEAASAFVRSVEVWPYGEDREHRYYRAGQLSLKAGHHEAALKYLEKATKQLNSTSADAWMDYGTALRSQGEFTQATAAYEYAIKLSPRHSSAYYNLASTLNASGRREEARDYVRQAVKLNPVLASRQLAVALLGTAT